MLFLLFFSFADVYPQTTVKSEFLDLRISGTYVLPHHKKMEHLVSRHFLYADISWVKQTQGNKYWHSLFNYPHWGVTFHYNNFGQNKYLGEAYAVYPYITLPLYQRTARQFSFRFGSGLGYISKPYDRIKNPKNVAISTHVNLCIEAGFEWEYSFNEQFKAYKRIALLHFSNGATRMPNTGINLPSLGLGVRYNLPKYNDEKEKAMMPTFEKGFYKSLAIAAGINEIYPTYGDKYPAFSLSFGYFWQPSLKRAVGLNLDLSYNTSDFETLKRRETDYKNYEMLRAGISVGQDLIFDRTTFVFAVGRYLYTQETRDGLIYNRVGYRRTLNDFLFFNLTLKSHMFRADFIECGLGVRF